MSNQQQRAGVELSDESKMAVVGRAIAIAAGRNTPELSNALFLSVYEAVIAADRQQRVKVEPVATNEAMRTVATLLDLHIRLEQAYYEIPPEDKRLRAAHLIETAHSKRALLELVWNFLRNPQAEKAPSAQAVEPVEVEERRLSAAMGMGNSLGIKSTDALKILAAYKSVEPSELTPAPQQPSVPDAAIASEQGKGKT
jgi:hypothetical protein